MFHTPVVLATFQHWLSYKRIDRDVALVASQCCDVYPSLMQAVTP